MSHDCLCARPRADPLPRHARARPAFSAEVFVIPFGDASVVYAPLRRAAFLASPATVDRIACLQDGTLDPEEEPDLVEFLRRLEIVDGEPEVPPVTRFAGRPKPVSVTLFLTTGCNLRCTYCYASAGDTPLSGMSLEVARRGIDFVVANAVERGEPAIEVAFHGGGEPTLQWATLTGAHAYARERAAACGLRATFALATNGVIPDAKLDWIVANLDAASLSFDGLPAVHDAHRIDAAGRGSAAQVIRTIRRFDETGFDYGLRLTVTREHIEALPGSVRFVCENFRPRAIQVEPAYQLGRWKGRPSAETAGFVAAFRAAQAIARAHGREITFSGARLGLLSNHFCGITQDAFSLTTEGDVSACYETFLRQNEWSKTFFYGGWDEAAGSYRFDLRVLDHLRGQTVDRRAHCRGCFAKWSCGGDCHHKALTVGGGGEFEGTDRCHIIRELTLDQIVGRIGASGGLFWHEPPGDGAPARAGGKELLR